MSLMLNKYMLNVIILILKLLCLKKQSNYLRRVWIHSMLKIYQQNGALRQNLIGIISPSVINMPKTRSIKGIQQNITLN